MSIQSAIDALVSCLGEAVSTSKPERDAHGTSESHFAVIPPDAVVFPQSREDVVKILQICNAENCPVIGWGTGTSLEGQTTPIQGGVCVDFSKMNAILEINAADMDVRVQPGITREDLNTQLRDTGLFFPVDPGANASIGGMASTRASGTTTVRYGTMRDNVIGLEVVLADGRIINTGTRARKSANGYDLTGLFVGAEGTLGLITELTLRLHGRPAATAAAIAGFPSIADAVETVTTAIQMGIPMARIEFLDADTVRACNQYSKRDMPLIPHLFLEFHGSETAVEEDAKLLGQLMEDFNGTGYSWATREEDRNALWDMRHKAYYAILSLRNGARAVVTDVCVPQSKLAEAVAQTRDDIEQAGLLGPILGHVGDGNFHAILLVDTDNPAEVATAKSVAKKMGDRAIAMGGTITGEHGIGMGKLNQMAAQHGDAWAVMGDIKSTMDPNNILNPGKMVQKN